MYIFAIGFMTSKMCHRIRKEREDEVQELSHDFN